MKVKQMIELVQKHHPSMNETEILVRLNDHNRELKQFTRIDKRWATLDYSAAYNTTYGYFDLAIDPKHVREVIEVEVDGDTALQYIGEAKKVGDTGSGSRKYFWWRDGEHLYVLYDGTTISIVASSVTVRMHYGRFASSLASPTDEPTYDEAFHRYLPYSVISEGYEENVATLGPAAYFYKRALAIRKQALKYASMRGMSGRIKQYDY